jgi:hypothetical protein
MNPYAPIEDDPPRQIGFDDAEPIGFREERSRADLEANRKRVIATSLAWAMTLAVFVLAIIAILVF